MISVTSLSKLREVSTFILVGVINTGIDFLVLNLLIVLFGVPVAGVYIVYKAISFLIANINGYFLHATFTFRSREKSFKSFSIFFLITTLGMVGNTIVAWLIFSPVRHISGDIVAGNLGALVGTTVSMGINYFAYKYVVFYTKDHA